MRVAGVADEGNVTIRLAFDDWREGNVAPATFVFQVPKNQNDDEEEGEETDAPADADAAEDSGE